MKVSELITELQRIDPDAIVVLQKDGEGNDYSPLSGAGLAWYEADSTWSGKVYNRKVGEALGEDDPDDDEDEDEDDDDDDDEEDEDEDEDEDDYAPDSAVRCAVLWPVN